MMLLPTHRFYGPIKPAGIDALRADRTRRIRWARGVKDDLVIHSDARIRRACRIFLAECGAADHGDRIWAEQMLKSLTPRSKP